MSSSVVIRPLEWLELPQYMNLRKSIEDEAEHLVVSRGERKETIVHVAAKMILTGERTRTLVAVENGQLVGYINTIFAKFKKLHGNAYLTMAVKNSHRGLGIGTQLLEAAENLAKTRDTRRMELEVLGNNTGAIKLYKKMGYTKEGTKKNAVKTESGFDDVIFMAKTLV
ncbi:MAG: GCN5-like N-acetyltransferase [Parcubacteria group bacterium Gr01-1014_3]|nr:MAG: GCN5-like N-acetyltransferase [Parcubacteria group bacterium Gr01-1014_3]